MGLVFHCRFMIPAFSACSHLFHHYSCYFSSFLYAYTDTAYFVKFFPCLILVSGKPHHSTLIVYSRVSEPVDHGRIFDGSPAGIIETEYVLRV